MEYYERPRDECSQEFGVFFKYNRPGMLKKYRMTKESASFIHELESREKIAAEAVRKEVEAREIIENNADMILRNLDITDLEYLGRSRITEGKGRQTCEILEAKAYVDSRTGEIIEAGHPNSIDVDTIYGEHSVEMSLYVMMLDDESGGAGQPVCKYGFKSDVNTGYRGDNSDYSPFSIQALVNLERTIEYCNNPQQSV